MTDALRAALPRPSPYRLTPLLIALFLPTGTGHACVGRSWRGLAFQLALWCTLPLGAMLLVGLSAHVGFGATVALASAPAAAIWGAAIVDLARLRGAPSGAGSPLRAALRVLTLL